MVMLTPDLITELQDMRYLTWSHGRGASHPSAGWRNETEKCYSLVWIKLCQWLFKIRSGT